MHIGERRSAERRELLDDRFGVAEMGPRIRQTYRIRESDAEGIARLDEIAFDQRSVLRSALREDVAGEERPRRGVEQVSGLPPVRNVRRIDPDDLALSDRETLAVVRSTLSVGDHEWPPSSQALMIEASVDAVSF